jgi:hypothetical protein
MAFGSGIGRLVDLWHVQANLLSELDDKTNG